MPRCVLFCAIGFDFFVHFFCVCGEFTCCHCVMTELSQICPCGLYAETFEVYEYSSS